MFKKSKHYFEYIFVFIVAYMANLIPVSLATFFGNRLGDIGYYLVPIRKKHALESLGLAFPEKNMREKRNIVRDVYRNLGRVAVNHCQFPGMSADEVLKKILFKDEEVLRQAASRGKGIVLTGAHFGDWESLGMAIAVSGYPVNVVIAPIHNPHIDKMISDQRHGMGVSMISRTGMAIRQIRQELKANRIVAMFLDQDAGKAGIFVDFFGRLASTPSGPVKFAVKTGAALVLALSFPQEDGSQQVIFEEISTDADNRTGDERIQYITQRVSSRVELHIRKNPGAWFGWLHRRWKSQPDF
jgi:KDO2-lipid IV(A) lauroyltransferase